MSPSDKLINKICNNVVHVVVKIMFDCLPSACRRQAKIEYIYTQTCEDSHSKDMDKAKDMEKIMVTSVVVTSNRKEWLERT